ncbi:hypothetical protein ACFQ73_07245 [Amycolatopsis japonica]|uniref:hypothetical protein n=1 Tax=Amycolatopsis japonica TaxID=208439 RepID=UPI00366DC665
MVDLWQMIESESAKAVATDVVNRLSTALSRISFPFNGIFSRRGNRGLNSLSSGREYYKDSLAAAVVEGSKSCWQCITEASGGVKLIIGLEGSGKLEVARSMATHMRNRFPGKYVEVHLPLRRFRDKEAFDPNAARRYFLHQVCINDEIPDGEESVEALFGRVLSNDLFIVVLDGVTCAEELALFADFQSSLVLATTARGTRELLKFDRRPIRLNGLSRCVAWKLLDDYSGDVILANEPVEAWRLIELCDQMPYALHEVGLSLSLRSGEARPLAALLDEYRLKGIVNSEQVVREHLDGIFAALSEPVKAACVLLASHPCGYFTRATAQAMIGGDGASVVFDEMLESHLVVISENRYSLPALVAGYAHGVSMDRSAGFHRLLAHVRDHAVSADRHINGDRLVCYEVPAVFEWNLQVSPVDWLDDHRTLIAELIKLAFSQRCYEEVCQLAGAFETLLNERWAWREYLEISEWAVLAAEKLQEKRPGQLVRALMMRAKALYISQRFEEAGKDLDRASLLLSVSMIVISEGQRLAASLAEFFGRFHEEKADYFISCGFTKGKIEAELSEAAIWMVRACRISVGDGGKSRDQSALGIQLRMLAGILVKLGRTESALSALLAIGDDVSVRNKARVHMTFVRMHLARRDLISARVHHAFASNLLASGQPTQYEWELRELNARIMRAEGDPAAAKEWGSVTHDAIRYDHPRLVFYLKEGEY